MSKAKELELEAVKCAESGNLQRALELLTEAQKVSSEYASVYNNRAQVSCIRGKHVRFDLLNKHCTLQVVHCPIQIRRIVITLSSSILSA